MRGLWTGVAAAAVVLGSAVPAHAGSYVVRSCVTSGGNVANEAWALRGASGITADRACGTSGTDSIGLVARSGATIPATSYAALTFTAPTGTTISNWTINRRWGLKGAPAKGVPRPYVTYVYGAGNVFGGGGLYTAAVRDALNKDRAWASYPEGDFSISSVTPRSSWRSLTGDKPESSLSVRLGCASGTACAIPGGGSAENSIVGSTVTIDDPTAPTVAVQAAGLLLAGGSRAGSDPIILTASDAGGIKAVEAIDVTDPAAPVSVAAENYEAGRNDKGVSCAYTKPAPCPQLTGETVVPTALQAGQRTLVVRVTDTAGNVTDSGPYPVAVASPSDRGAANGAGATDTATLGGRFKGGRKAKRMRTVGYGKRPVLTGTLRNGGGQPVAGALLHVNTRDAGSSRWAARGTVKTGAEGRWRLRVKPGPSRKVRVGWRARLNDVSPAAKVDFDLRVRGGASLAAPRSVALGRSFTLRGRLRGADRNRRVSIVAQGKAPGAGFQTFRDTRTDRKGRIKVRYRFTQPGSRGSTFRIRVKLLPTRGWPYAAGTTKTVRIRVR